MGNMLKYQELLENCIGDDFKVAQLLVEHAPDFFVPVEHEEPPLTNRGVQDTELFDYNVFLHKDLQVSFDWLEFTIKDTMQETMSEYDYVINRSMDLFLRFLCVSVLGLPRDDFYVAGKGMFGYQYKYSYAYGNISILCGGTPEQGYHVIITGEGCRSLFVHTTPQLFINNVRNAGGHFGRVDIALDDYNNKYYTVSDLCNHIMQTEIVSNWRDVSINTGYSTSDASCIQQTIYFGSMRSDMYMRVYDKYLEQQNKKGAGELPEGVKGWTRWELVFRRRRADAVITAIVNADFNLGNVFCGLLSECMRIVDINPFDTNRSRWSMSIKWIKFLGSVRPLKLTVQKIKESFSRKKEWLQSQIMPTFSAVLNTVDGLPWVFGMIANCLENMSGRADLQLLVKEYNKRCCGGYVLDAQKRKTFWKNVEIVFQAAGASLVY